MKFVNAHGVTYVPDRFLAYDDVLLLPRYSDIPSRNDPSIRLNVRLAKDAELATPIISAPMDTVTGADMAIALGSIGGLGILHRFYPSKDAWLQDIRRVVEKFNAVAFAIGAASEDADLVGEVLKITPNVLVCVDVAHGHTALAARQVKTISHNYPDAHIMAGSIATPDAVETLIAAGASSLRCGVGGGSMCRTREITGHGVPNLTMIMQCRTRINAMRSNVTLIADGGIRHSGDIVKALAAGADAVMLGGLLAGTTETPTAPFTGEDGKLYRKYRGQASADFMQDIGKEGVTPEGVSTLIPDRGSVIPIVQNLLGGIRSGMTYSGVRTLPDLTRYATFIEVTNAGYIEGTPHGAKS